MSKVKISGTWKDVTGIKTKSGGTWKDVSKGYVKSGGTWKEFFSAADIPAGTYAENVFLGLVNNFVSAGTSRTFVTAVTATIGGKAMTNWTAIQRYSSTSGAVAYQSSHNCALTYSGTTYTLSQYVFPINVLSITRTATIVLNEDITFA